MDISTPSNGLSYNDRVLIVDGLNHYIRSFTAVPTLNGDGVHVGGITGFLVGLSYIIRKLQPTRVILVFDGSNSTKKRKQMLSSYKSGRAIKDNLNRRYMFESAEHERESMKIQFKRLYEYLILLPVNIIILDNTEADDVISYISSFFKNEVIICSTDKDFYQLINESVSIYNPIKKEIITSQTIMEKFPTSPQNFIHYKCIMGDKGDAIDGINGIGAVTIGKLLPILKDDKRYSIDEIFEYLENVDNSNKDKILNNRELYERNFNLMQLHDPLMNGLLKSRIRDILSENNDTYNRFLIRKLLGEDKIDPTKIMNGDNVYFQLNVLYKNYVREDD